MRRAAAYLVVICFVSACDREAAPLVSPAQISGDAIPAPLSTVPGNALVGEAVFSSREHGHCVLCHVVDGLDVPFQGNVGPALTGIGGRLTDGQIRLRIADPARLNPETVMPSYYRLQGLHQVGAAYRGKPVLSAEQIEHLVAYLSTLKS